MRILRRSLVVALAALALGSTSADADIGIVSVSPAAAKPGDEVRARVEGYLGAQPWRAFAIVLVARAAEPRPYRCGANTICTPTRLPAALRKPPFHVVGSITRWHRSAQAPVNGWGQLAFRVPPLARGVYVPMLVCAACVPGPRASLIATTGLVLDVG